MEVKNLNGSGSLFPKPTCKCDSWLEHWAINKRYNPTVCRCCRKQRELVGGHVVKVNSSDARRYIVPICKECNAQKDRVFIVDEVDLVSANCDHCINK